MMAISLKEVSRRCIGPCGNQNVVVNIDGKYASLSGFLKTVQGLARETRVNELTQLLSSIVRLMQALTDIARMQEVTISKNEMNIIKEAIKNYKGQFDLYFLVGEKELSATDFMLSRSELEALYRIKARDAVTVESKSHYSAVMNDVAILYSKMRETSDAITVARAALQKIEKHITPEERSMRGYDLTVEQRIQRNVELFKGKFGELPGENIQDPLTLGRYYDVPGMIQGHRVFSIDTLTGMIFCPKEIERHASFLRASYEQKEHDATTLDYVFAEKHPEQQQVITLPPGYSVFPLQFIFNKIELSGEAQGVIDKTQLDLFLPLLADLEKAKKRTMDPELIKRLSSLKRHFGYGP